MNKNHLFHRWEYKIRRTRKIAPMKPEAVTHCMDHRPDNFFRLGVARTYPRHQLASSLRNRRISQAWASPLRGDVVSTAYQHAAVEGMAILELEEAEVQRSVDDARRDVRYLVTDYPVDTLVFKYNEENPQEGDIYVPPYQRKMQWEEARSSYFIESLILRVPVPPLFFYEVEGRLEIVDGSQRIRTLVSFYKNEFKLTNLEKLDMLNGMKFENLPGITKKRLANTPIRAFILEEGTDETTRIELFRRINTSSKQLTEAEIRKGAYQGPFLDLVLDCSDRPTFQRLVPGTGTRGNSNPANERQELTTRFFIYCEFYESFVHDVRRFLDHYFKLFNEKLSNSDLSTMSAEFDAVMDFISNHMPTAFFRTSTTKQVPRVRFEAIAVGVALALRQNPDIDPTDMSWLYDEEFLQLIRTDASNSGPRLRGRIDYVRDKLLENI